MSLYSLHTCPGKSRINAQTTIEIKWNIFGFGECVCVFVCMHGKHLILFPDCWYFKSQMMRYKIRNELLIFFITLFILLLLYKTIVIHSVCKATDICNEHTIHFVECHKWKIPCCQVLFLFNSFFVFVLKLKKFKWISRKQLRQESVRVTLLQKVYVNVAKRFSMQAIRDSSYKWKIFCLLNACQFSGRTFTYILWCVNCKLSSE